MALIQCPECSNDVSDTAISCPKCGYHIDNDKKKFRKTPGFKKYIRQSLNSNNKLKTKLFIILLLIFIIVVFLVFKMSTDGWSGHWKINQERYNKVLQEYKSECEYNLYTLPQSHKDFINNFSRYTFELKREFDIGRLPYRKVIYIYDGIDVVETKKYSIRNRKCIPLLGDGNNLSVNAWIAYGEHRIHIYDNFHEYDFDCSSIGYFILERAEKN